MGGTEEEDDDDMTMMSFSSNGGALLFGYDVFREGRVPEFTSTVVFCGEAGGRRTDPGCVVDSAIAQQLDWCLS